MRKPYTVGRGFVVSPHVPLCTIVYVCGCGLRDFHIPAPLKAENEDAVLFVRLITSRTPVPVINPAQQCPTIQKTVQSLILISTIAHIT
jgi:hypothetical protein